MFQYCELPHVLDPSLADVRLDSLAIMVVHTILHPETCCKRAQQGASSPRCHYRSRDVCLFAVVAPATSDLLVEIV
jgi:hypothetical protein